jgi:hypothetical protein
MKVIVLNLHGARVDAFGAYGSSWVTTPHLDRLAAEGVVFDQHYAEEIEFSNNDTSPERPLLNRGEILERSLLGIIGYLKSRQVPTACFRDARVELGLTRIRFKQVVEVQAADLPVLEQPTITDGVFQLAIDWVQQFGTHYADWLLMLDVGALLPPWNEKEQHGSQAAASPTGEDDPGSAMPRFEYTETGNPEPPPERFGWKRAYAGAMQYVDDLIGQFLNLLKELELDQECLISVTSFEGQPLGERSTVAARDWGLHEELIHLPLILRLPQSQGGGRRVHQLTQFPNWCAMLAEAFDLKDCWPGDPDRYSLLSLARGHGKRLNEYLIIEASSLVIAASEFPEPNPREIAVRTPDWFLILPCRGWQQRPAQLYRKPEDRWEMNNVIKEHPDVADHLELTWHRHRQLRIGKGESPTLRDDILKISRT